MTPYECVGFPFLSDEDYDHVVPGVLDRMMAEARRLPSPTGFEGWSYRDPSGAGLLAFLQKDPAKDTRSLTCMKPVFFGGSRQQATAVRLIEAEECPFCDIAWVEVKGADGAVAYPAVVRISDPSFRRFNWTAGASGRLQITLLAMELDPFKREAGGSGRIRGLADRAFLPSGTLENPPRPEASVSGHVLQAEKRRNQLGGGEFIWARIASQAAEYDMVIPASLLPVAPQPGTVLQASARVYARWFKK